MRIKIHKGSHEIGGNCIELSHNGRSILLDLGQPLNPESKETDLSGVNPEALLVSHPHQDHHGLMEKLSPEVPIYMGELGRAFIDASRMFRRKKLLNRDFRHIKNREKFEVAGFTVTPWLMDHSTPEAFAFLVEAGGRRVFYSGDFRAHGKKGALFDRLVAHPPRDVDALIMEGTNLGRESGRAGTEDEMGREIHSIIKDQKNISFLVCSGQNVDRLTCAWKACRDAGKAMVIDLYIAWVLEKMKLKTNGVPGMEWRGMRVLFTGGQPDTIKDHPEYFGGFLERAERRSIEKEEIYERPENYLSAIRLSGAWVVGHYLNRREPPVNLIYSQWLGYIAPENCQRYGTERMASFRNTRGINFHYVHTSGHADLDHLKTFAKAINARMVLPVHTECLEEFDRHFDNVVQIEDGYALLI